MALKGSLCLQSSKATNVDIVLRTWLALLTLTRLISAYFSDGSTNASHTACQQPQGSLDQLGATLTVVDCQSKSKVPLAQGERYLALSYRWGKPPGCDDPWAVSAAPRTLRDAMTLTLKLGFRYLWVDRHCIDQKNEANKAKELAIMDHIYENATLTIVGMAGADDASGLLGIRTEPIVSRNEQLQAVFSRAHTCSIELGSFDFDQVYFLCRAAYWSESLPNFPNIKVHEGDGTVAEYGRCSGSNTEVSLSNVFYFEAGGLESVPGELARFERDVNIYIKRMMGDQIDRLNACRGVLSHSVYCSYYGPQELPTDVWTIPSSDVKVWLPVKKGLPRVDPIQHKTAE
ncbi:heterokaryon incompatibility protein-domain-containing protein [Ustulina deusta]|nr:heterokaryon incompatibility protein-domain-containing protein [Ustulina deusta]